MPSSDKMIHQKNSELETSFTSLTSLNMLELSSRVGDITLSVCVTFERHIKNLILRWIDTNIKV